MALPQSDRQPDPKPLPLLKPSATQATDSIAWGDDKKPSRMIQETFAKAKDELGLQCPGQLPSITPRHPSGVRRPRSLGTRGGSV